MTVWIKLGGLGPTAANFPPSTSKSALNRFV